MGKLSSGPSKGPSRGMSKGPSRSVSHSSPKPASRPSSSSFKSSPKPASSLRSTPKAPVSSPMRSTPKPASHGILGNNSKPAARVTPTAPKRPLVNTGRPSTPVKNIGTSPKPSIGNRAAEPAKSSVGIFGNRPKPSISNNRPAAGVPIKSIGAKDKGLSNNQANPVIRSLNEKKSMPAPSGIRKSSESSNRVVGGTKQVLPTPTMRTNSAYGNTSYRSEPLRMNSITSGLPMFDNNYGRNQMYGAMPVYGGTYADQYYGGIYPTSIGSRMNSVEYQEKVLLSRIACCLYVAYADNMIMDSEKNVLDSMIDGVIKNNKCSLTFKAKVRNLAKTRISSFIEAETYFQQIEAEDMIPLISLAEDMADADNAISADESKAVSKIKSYVSNMTGYDFTDTTFDDAKYQDDLLLAKLAVCCYIANSDEHFTDDERNEVGTIINQLLKNGTVQGELKEEVNAIVNSEDKSFILVEKYLQNIKDEDLIPLINVADEISDKGFHVTIDESKAVNKLRIYVSNRTGEDFYSVEIDEKDLICPGCAARMEIIPGNIIECPFCGIRKSVNKPSSNEDEE